jgi:hypothetical protein
MESSNIHMSIDERIEKLVLKVENLVCGFAKDKLKALENEEAKLKRLLRPSAFDLDDWLPIKSCIERLKEIQSQQRQLRKRIFLHQEKVEFHYEVRNVLAQVNNTPLNLSLDVIQEPSRENNSNISLERIVETNGENASEIQESDDDVVVDAACDEMIDDLEKVVKTPCVENVESLEEVFEATHMEDVGCTKECLEVVDYGQRLGVDLIIQQASKCGFVKVDFVLEKSPTLEYVHVSRFVEFNPTKIRGRVFAKKGKMQQITWSGGNTSKLINLVSLFNIWVWLIMQVRAFILTCLIVLESMVFL